VQLHASSQPQRVGRLAWQDDRVSDLDEPWAAVGFDLDGTLFDHRRSATSAVRHLLISLDHAPTPELVEMWFRLEAEHFEAWRVGRVTFAEQRRLRLRAFLTELRLPARVGDAATDALFARYLGAYRASWRAFEEAAPLLGRLRAQGTKIGVLTNGSRAQQLDKLDVIALAPLVDIVCTSEELGFAKPDRRAFEALAQRLGAPIGEIAFVGDHPEHDLTGAIGAGMPAALVDHYGTVPVGLTAALRSAQRH
jgi:putative hydrolase of the HAD superfamily